MSSLKQVAHCMLCYRDLYIPTILLCGMPQDTLYFLSSAHISVDKQVLTIKMLQAYTQNYMQY